jgi:hypothetical protein
MISLATLTDIQHLKYICDSVKNSVSWPQFVSEAEMLDVKVWLGDALLNEIITQASTLPITISADNKILLDGGAYQYPLPVVANTRTYLFQGLRDCIAYYAFARFTNRTAYNYTAAGIVIKDSDLSTPVGDKIVQRLETEARLTAEAIKCEITLFLDRNYSLYPLWRDGECHCGGSCQDTRGIFKVVGD